MNVIKSLGIPEDQRPIQTVEMHTYGMPTRLIISGHPELSGTLLEQKAEAEKSHDHIRRMILLEPRGHADMFGAILRPNPELTETGEAHMGILYMHGHGYSYMCGHATIALCRFLIDTADLSMFPRRNAINHDSKTQTAEMFIHTPGGLVRATVPTIHDGKRSDPSRPVSFVAVPAYAIATDISISIPSERMWPELSIRQDVKISLAYCGVFIVQILLEELGFSSSTLRQTGVDFALLKHAAGQLRDHINTDPDLKYYLRLPHQDEYGTVHGLVVTDREFGTLYEGSRGAELGVYIFGGNHIDRSPTGSAAAARIALDFARGRLSVGDSWTYHSVLSHAFDTGGLVATILEVEGDTPGIVGPVTVQIEGYAYYTGCSTFVVESGDIVGGKAFFSRNLFDASE